MMLMESQSQPRPAATSSVVVPAPTHDLAQFFDLARDLFCIAGLDGCFKLVNAAFERVLGYSCEQLVSRSFVDFVHPDDVERAIDALSQLASGEDVNGFESRLICADGSVRRFEWNTRTMPYLGVVYAMGRDVTERTALAEEQDALRRVATLVARESSPRDIFAAVVEEMGRIVGVERTAMLRYETDGLASPIASWGDLPLPTGARFPFEDELCHRVFATARPARVDRYAHTACEVSAVGAPIIVHGRLWGAMIAIAAESLREDVASRMVPFTELVATAIANIDDRSALAASGARIVAAADEARRRVVRDLHDGAQQRLVHAIVALQLAQEALERDAADAVSLVGEALEQAQNANSELRELAHGILPAALTSGGLRAGIGALASRMLIPVQLEICSERLAATVEATAYFVVAEALTNVAKHAHAASAAVTVRVVDRALRIEVRDDGVGGARPDGGGLRGLGDRLAALDGRLQFESPAGGGTLVAAVIPVAASASDQRSVVTPREPATLVGSLSAGSMIGQGTRSIGDSDCLNAI